MLEEIKLLIPLLEGLSGSVVWLVVGFLVKDVLMHLLGACVFIYTLKKIYLLIARGNNLEV